jgi:cytochrome c-type biogenesis protein CcmE
MTHRQQDGPEPVVSEGGILSSNRGKLLIAFVVLIGAFGYLGFIAFQSATVYYYTVGELQDLGPTPEGRMVRVNGKLVEDSFERIDTSTLARFSLTDGSDTLSAAHDGILPNLFFNEHSEIILEGSYGQDGVFQSHNVIVKCPSKYVAAEESG